jgi:hypothetical protein
MPYQGIHGVSVTLNYDAVWWRRNFRPLEVYQVGSKRRFGDIVRKEAEEPIKFSLTVSEKVRLL